MPGKDTGKDAERRRNVELRDLLDELLALVRQLARRGNEMKPDELAYAQQRMEWLSDEIWRTSIALSGDQEDDVP
ncbi:MAG TPA: hypothetical protein VMM18_07020 [Gemmatimonadaceae bacterium]|nr:hypothetical protein [Gemmatimonadaceae bacterium]